MLEKHLGNALFERGRRSIRLTENGRTYLGDIQRILTDIRATTERQCDRALNRSLRIVSTERFAQIWLMPQLVGFKAAHPNIAVNLETHFGDIDPHGKDFDFWITFIANDTPQIHQIPHTPFRDFIFEEPFMPFCSPALIQARGRPAKPADLLDWPLLYHLGWESDWLYWFSRHGVIAPDLSRASGFRVYSMIVQSAVEGLGAAVGSPSLISDELDRRVLVPLLEANTEAALQWCLFTHIHARERTEVKDFRAWVLNNASSEKSN